MERNLTEFTRNLGRCSDFFVTFYWKSAATGAHLYIIVVTLFINITLSLFGTFANIFVISAYCKSQRVRTLSNMLLVSLACGDLLVTALTQPLCCSRTLKEILGSHDCFLWTWTRLMSYFSCGVSLLTVAIITIERFITLAYPYRHHRIVTSVRLKIVVASTWLASLGLVISHLGLIPYNIILSIGALLMLLTILTVIVVWIWIHRILRRHMNIIETSQTPSGWGNEKLSRKQVFRNTTTSYLIVMALLFCYLPTFAMLVYFSTEPVNFVAIFLLTPWSETIMFANSVLNPVFLLWRKRDFRATARIMLRCLTQNNKRKGK